MPTFTPDGVVALLAGILFVIAYTRYLYWKGRANSLEAELTALRDRRGSPQ